jgi:hypothetical protein
MRRRTRPRPRRSSRSPIRRPDRGCSCSRRWPTSSREGADAVRAIGEWDPRRRRWRDPPSDGSSAQVAGR